MMHNSRLANPLDDYTRALKAHTGKRGKADEDFEKIARIEWEGGLYFDDRGVIVPAANVEACLLAGAKLSKLGKEVERKLWVEDDSVLEYEGKPKKLNLSAPGFFEKFHDVRMVRVGQKRVLRCRGFFRKWSLETELLTEMNRDDVERVARDAGRYIGLCEYGRRYGRFTVEVV